MTQLLGTNTFFDSFQHPESYQYLKYHEKEGPEQKMVYIILEKPTNQECSITKGDMILYRTTKETIECRTVYATQLRHGEKIYYTTTPNEDNLDGPIFSSQILGKSTTLIDDNLWNALSVHIWGLVIENLNVVTFFSST